MGEDDVARIIGARLENPFLTSEQAAHYLGLSPRQLEIMRGRGDGPVFRRHARFVRYHLDDLNQWSENTRRSISRA